MNKTQLKIIIHKYSSICSRLLKSDPDDYINNLKKFISYLDSTEIINEYIKSCGKSELNMETLFQEVFESYDECCFPTGDSECEEIRNIYAILNHLCENYAEVPDGLYFAYSNGNEEYVNILKTFNNRVTMVLIQHIENYLTEVGIRMGFDENVTYNINGNMVNIANDGATINATQINNGINANELKALLNTMRESLDSNLPEEDRAEASECIDAIEAELLSPQPNETIVKDKFKLLKRIDASFKFVSTCCSLLTFADKVYPFLDTILPTFQALLP